MFGAAGLIILYVVFRKFITFIMFDPFSLIERDGFFERHELIIESFAFDSARQVNGDVVLIGVVDYVNGENTGVVVRVNEYGVVAYNFISVRAAMSCKGIIRNTGVNGSFDTYEAIIEADEK